MSFYIPLEISEERKIWDELKSMTKEERNHYANVMTQEEIVEDAGLDINIDDIKKVDTGFEDISSKEQVEPKKIIG